MDGVQCNMTNTMNTPVEALEISYPLRVERYELREGIGGAGRTVAGTASYGRSPRSTTTRASLCNLTDAALPPYGLHGGDDGTTGRNWFSDRDGKVPRSVCPGKKAPHPAAPARLPCGVETPPGGGGWGREGSRADYAVLEGWRSAERPLRGSQSASSWKRE